MDHSPVEKSAGECDTEYRTSTVVPNKQGGLQKPSQKTTKKKKVDPEQRAAQSFPQRKQEILRGLGVSACDLSPKGSVDEKCAPIINLLNQHPEYVTTSSCSGRIALFHSTASGDGDDGEEAGGSSVKRGGASALGWLLVKHGMLLPQEMQLMLDYLCGPAQTPEEEAVDKQQMAVATAVYEARDCDEWYGGELEGLLSRSEERPLPAVPMSGTMSLKMEPFVLHVQCLRTDSAKRLLSAAIGDSGYRNSGMIPPGRRIMCGIRTAAGLGMEVPLVLDGVNYLRPVARNGTPVGMGESSCVPSREYLWALLHRANQKMCANEQKIQLLLKNVTKRLIEVEADP